MTSEVDVQFILNTLARFEVESNALLVHRDLVELFCLQIIPFLQKNPMIEPLRTKWMKKYKGLLAQVTALEAAALQEVIAAFRQIQETVGKRKGVAKKIARIDGILSGNPEKVDFTSWPLYRVAFSEVRELLEMVLERRGQKICKNYATLGARIVKTNEPSKVKKIPCVVQYTFAPSVELAGLALDALDWDRVKDPAIIWGCFESALRYWRTSESYFEQTLHLLKKNANPFPALSERFAWLEIATNKNYLSIDHEPTVFTVRLFKEGLRTIVNEITAFVSSGCQLKEGDHPASQAMLELHLNENRLWVFVHLESSEIHRFYLKRFNDGSKGSGPHEFIQDLLRDYPNGGDVLIDFADRSENVSKVLARIGMSGLLKDQFFGQSRGNKVVFRGCQISIPCDEKCRLLLEELSRIHCHAGSPEYIGFARA
jgi:hypothetical protein